MIRNIQADLAGKTFGKLTVLEETSPARYRCRCDCGNELSITKSELLSGHKRSCGCLKTAPKAGDITGMRSGTVTAIEKTALKRRGSSLWRCRCDCGKELMAEPYKILHGKIKSCGCKRHQKQIRDLTGLRFGKLVPLERLEEKIGSSYAWRCRCDCGNETTVSASRLLRGGTKSCGCGKVEAIKETIRRHGTVADHQHFIDGTCVERILAAYKLRADNSSGYTGIQLRKGRYVAMITFKQKVYYLGSFERLEDALSVRKKAEKMLFEPFLDGYHGSLAAQTP